MKQAFKYIIAVAMLFGAWACENDDCKDCGENGESPLGLVINEVHPSDYPAWVEIYNAGAHPVSTKGLVVTLDKELQYTINTDVTIPIGGYHILWFGDSIQVEHTGFSLPAGGGHLSLYDADGLICDDVTYPGLPSSQSWGRTRDGEDRWSVYLYPTCRRSNDPLTNHPPNIYYVRMNDSTPPPNEAIYILTEASDDVFVDLVELHYGYAGFDSVVTMNPFSCGTSFRGEIPPLPANTEVEFYITARDFDTLYNIYPSSAPADKVRFKVDVR